MASRSGPRAEGTDGSDFQHRETIADYYSKSAELKGSVRKCLIPHLVLFITLVGKGAALLMGSTYFLPLETWEMCWLVSGIFAGIGLTGLKRNDKKRLIMYVIVNIVFGIIPLGFGAVQLVNSVLNDFKDMKNTPKQWKNSPTKMAVVAVCLSWQITGIFRGIGLIRTWQQMGNAKRKVK